MSDYNSCNNFDEWYHNVIEDYGKKSLNSEEESSHTPQWIVECEELFDSCLSDKGDTATPSLAYKIGFESRSTMDSTGERTYDGKVRGKPLWCAVKSGSWGPLIQNVMIKHQCLKNVFMHRRQFINANESVITRTYAFSTCKVTKCFDSHQDVTGIAFIYESYEATEISYDHEGNKIGNTVSSMNFATGVATQK